MPRPSAYPPTDTSEHEALATLLGILHLDMVKPDLKGRDKHPNTDGTLELVDDLGIPIGKLDIQVRKIPPSEKHYDCDFSGRI